MAANPCRCSYTPSPTVHATSPRTPLQWLAVRGRARVGLQALLDSSAWEPLIIIKSKAHFGVQRAGLHRFFRRLAKTLAGLRAGLVRPRVQLGFSHNFWRAMSRPWLLIFRTELRAGLAPTSRSSKGFVVFSCDTLSRPSLLKHAWHILSKLS